MAVATGEEQTADPIRRFAIRWGIVFGLILVAFIATVVTLNLTLYSASGFVGSYLAAVARHDVAAALATPGVEIPDDAAPALLTPAALGDLSDIHLVSDTDLDGGQHRIVYEFDLDGATGRTEFVIEHTGGRLLFFDSWSFATSPTATLEITPLNEAQFDANGVSIDSAGGPSVPVLYAVLTPGAFSLSHESELLAAAPESILVLEPGATTAVEVAIRASDEFVQVVQEELDALLDECTTQTVLQPTGCPFGETITNRIEGTPVWSIASYPVIIIVPGETPGTWQVPPTVGQAHLVVDVRSLFDGTLSTFDEDVPFTVGYLITFTGEGGVTITAR